MKNESLMKIYDDLNLNPKGDFGINIVYHILNPIFSSYFDLDIIGEKNIGKEFSPILFISRHYDEIDILCQQKVSKEIRNRFPSYLVKKDLAFLDNFSFGTIPFYRGRDLSSNKKEHLIFNEKVISNLIPSILGNLDDFVIYPEGTRRKGKKFRIQDKVLEDIIRINNLTHSKFEILPNLVSVDYKREDKNIKMKFGKPFRNKNLNKSELREYLYENINY